MHKFKLPVYNNQLLTIVCSPGKLAILNPEIHEDHTVTFKVQEPGAEEVKLTGDWMPAEDWVPGSVTMVRD